MRMTKAVMLGVGLAAIVAAPLSAQTYGPPPPPPRPAQNQNCTTPENPDELVVCGQRQAPPDENSPYRIPRELRQQRQIDDEHVSWDTRTRDLEAAERFSSQNVGASGMSQHSRQVDCQWRVARQEARGERPDCGRSNGFGR